MRKPLDRALDLLASFVLGDDGRRWGELAAPFQWQDARAVLDFAAVPYHYLTRARGGSKTTDLAALAVSAMLALLPDRSRLFGIAADRDQGALLTDAAAGLVARTPELAGAVRADAFRLTTTRSGSTFDVLAADAAGAWGLRPDFVVVDELSGWGTTPQPRRIFEAVTSAVAKVRTARLAIITTSGDPAHWSRGVLDHALADPLWRVHEVEGPAPWLDSERLAEQRRRLPDFLYERLFQNRWTASQDRLASPDDLTRCVTLDGPLEPQPERRYVIGLDVGIRRDATVATVCHAEPRANHPAGLRVVLDRIEVWQGSGKHPVELSDVEAWIEQASAAYNGATIVADPWQAVGMCQRLRQRRLRVEEYAFTAQSVGRLARTLLSLVADGALDLPDDEALLDELANVRLRETAPGVLRLDHDPDRHDDRAVALALAASSLVSREQPSGEYRVTVPRGRIPDALGTRVVGPRLGDRLTAAHERQLAETRVLAGQLGVAVHE